RNSELLRKIIRVGINDAPNGLAVLASGPSLRHHHDRKVVADDEADEIATRPTISQGEVRRGGRRRCPPPHSTAEVPQSPVRQVKFPAASAAHWVRPHSWPDQVDGTEMANESPWLRMKPVGESGGEPGFDRMAGHML
ncbi:LOW QUALITY PROTEIN: hypothetical protein PanWU01x14_201960, partial [Parasponia andersonii]